MLPSLFVSILAAQGAEAPSSGPQADATPHAPGTVPAVLDERRVAPAILDVVASEEMGRAGDRDAALALRRAVGVALRDRRFLEIRGMRASYASTLVHGAVAPSPDPFQPQVPLDVFPSPFLERIVIQKSWTPDRPAAFGSGLVDLRTVRPPAGFTGGVSVLGGYRAGTSFATAPRHPGTATDVFTFGSTGRALPSTVADAAAEGPIRLGDAFGTEGYTPEELEALGEAMPNNWASEAGTVPPDFRVDGWLGHGGQSGPLRYGVLGAAMLRQEWLATSFERTYYGVGIDEPQPENVYAFDETTGRSGLGVYLTAGAEIGPDHGARYVFALTRSGESLTRLYEGFNGDLGSDIRMSRLQWVEQRMANHQLHGFHRVGPLLAEWRAVASEGGRDEPDRRELRYDVAEDGTATLSDRPEGNQRLYSASDETYREAALDLTLRQRPSEPTTGLQLKLGVLASQRARDVGTRRYRFLHRGALAQDPATLQRPPDQVFTPDTIGPDGFSFEERTQPTDQYEGTQRIQAGFAMVDTPIVLAWRIMVGVRAERSLQEVRTYQGFGDLEVLAEIDTLDVLPAAATTVAILPELQLRASMARTVVRPGLRQLSPATYTDVTSGYGLFGNPELERARVTHGDVRLEWFPGVNDVFSVTGFRKWMEDPIEAVVIPSATLSGTWINAASARTTGVELEARKGLAADLYMAGNVTLVQSVVESAEGAGTGEERPLSGQAPWMVNAQVGWDPPGGDQLAVLYSAVGPRVSQVGVTFTEDPRDTYEQPVHLVDVLAQKQITPSWAVLLQAGNVLDARTRRTISGDLPVDEVRTGRTFAAGLTWTP